MTAYAMSITPFGADGGLDEGLFRTHLRYIAAAGVGVYVASQGSGEGDLLSFDEKIRCYEIAAEELDGVAPVVAAGVGLAAPTASVRELARAAADAGVDAVQVLGPRPGPMVMRPDEVEAYFRTVIESIACDVHVSSNAVLAGAEVPVALMQRLVAEYAHARVVNVSDRAPSALAAYVEQLVPHAEVRVGTTSELAASHALGATGFLSFEANVAPQLVADACATMHLDPLLRLNRALARGGNPRSLKAALRILDRDGGALRPPYLTLTAADHDELARELHELGLV
jgi:dihydrodipicolinate synthase/N-acetylneuraminate lyase